MPPSKWLNCQKTRPNAKFRLVCFPWCGGGSQFYARWGCEFPDNIEVVGVRLPGRETRRDENYSGDLSQVVHELCQDLHRYYSDKPLAFFGHSMGAVLALEAARVLKATHDLQVVYMFLSSSFPPQSEYRQKDLECEDGTPIIALSDKKLIERITRHGGTPKTILEDKDFMKKFFLPPYKADLKLAYQYKFELPAGDKQLSCPILMFDGKEDIEHYLEEFKELTSSKKFRIITFPGKHFWLLTSGNATSLRKRITEALAAL